MGAHASSWRRQNVAVAAELRCLLVASPAASSSRRRHGAWCREEGGGQAGAAAAARAGRGRAAEGKPQGEANGGGAAAVGGAASSGSTAAGGGGGGSAFARMTALARVVALYICREAPRQINLPHAIREEVLRQFRELSERHRWAPQGTDAVAYALRTCSGGGGGDGDAAAAAAAAATDVVLTIRASPQPPPPQPSLLPGTPGRSEAASEAVLQQQPLFGASASGAAVSAAVAPADHSGSNPAAPPLAASSSTGRRSCTPASFAAVLGPPTATVVQLMASNSLHPFCAQQREAFAAATLHSTGVFSACAIALHNFPEGLATFVAALDDPAVGVGVACAIAMHNIPEGLCVSMPLYYSSKSRCKALLWSTLSGVTETLGAALGYFILSAAFTPFTFGAVFGAVAGIMVYLSFVELIPAARAHDPDGAYAGRGLFAGMAVMALSLALFTL